MHRTALAAVAVTVVACGGAPPAEPAAPRRPAKEAIKEARALIDEAYDAMRAGKPANVMGLLAPDLFLVGPGPADVGLDRAAAMELAGSLVDDRKKHKLKSYGLEVYGGPDGHTAYAVDQVDYDGTSFAVTAVAAEVDGLWTLTTIEVSRAISNRRLDQAVAPAELPRWRPGDDAKAVHAEAPRDLLKALTLAGDDVDLRLDQFGKDRDATFVGPSPDEVIVGRKALDKKWKKRAPRYQVGPMVGAASSDGGLVWIVANATRVADDGGDRKRDDRGGDGDADRGAPRRLFAIYRDDGGDAGWSLAVLHETAVVAR